MSDAVGAAPPAAAAPPSSLDGASFSPERLRQLYRALLLPRLIEEKALLLLRQGRLSKWFSGMGQEAIAVGVARTALTWQPSTRRRWWPATARRAAGRSRR